MNFDDNEEQQLLADSVRRFMHKDYDFEARRKFVASAEGYSDKVWGALAEMGLTGIPFSPDHGGFGGGAVDLMSVMEAFGAVSHQQTATIQTLAPGVSAALLTTIAGLLVAIPSLFGYNFILNTTKNLITELENYASSLADRIELESK